MTEPSPTERLAGMITGFWASQMVYVAAKLGLADLLAGGPMTADELAQATGTHPGRCTGSFVPWRASASSPRANRRRFSLTPLAEPLRADVPGSQRATVLMMVGQFYDAWGDLIGSVRTGQARLRDPSRPAILRVPRREPGRGPDLRRRHDGLQRPEDQGRAGGVRLLGRLRPGRHRGRQRGQSRQHPAALSRDAGNPLRPAGRRREGRSAEHRT